MSSSQLILRGRSPPTVARLPGVAATRIFPIDRVLYPKELESHIQMFASRRLPNTSNGVSTDARRGSTNAFPVA
jgi:hypothetical protein